MKKIIILCVMVLNISEAKVDTLSIERAIEISLKQSPDVRISNLDFKSALKRNEFQQGYYLPTVNLSATTGKQEMKFKREDSISSNALIGVVNVSWLLYDFGKTSGSVDSFEHESVAYRATMYQQIAHKILMVKTNYYEVLKAKSIIGVHEKSLLLQENQLIRAKRYFESGIKTIIDVSDAEVRLSQAKLDLNDSNYNLKLRRSILEESMGMVDNGNYRLEHKELPLPNIIQTLPHIKTSLAQLEGFAYDHRQELKRADAIKRSMESKIESIEGDYYPTIALKGDYSIQNVTDDISLFTSQKQWKAGVVMEWNLFAGHQTDASVQGAKIDNMRSIAQHNQIRLLIKREVVDSYLGLKRSQDAIVLSQSILKSSQNKYNQAQKRYDNELSDYIELQEARQGYITSLSNLVTLYYDYYISMAKLDYAVGK